MQAELQEHVAFHLTGKRSAAAPDTAADIDLRPALLARYRDLTQLRYDFPLLLVRNAAADRTCVQSLSAIIDGLAHAVAHDDDADERRRLFGRIGGHGRSWRRVRGEALGPRSWAAATIAAPRATGQSRNAGAGLSRSGSAEISQTRANFRALAQASRLSAQEKRSSTNHSQNRIVRSILANTTAR